MSGFLPELERLKALIESNLAGYLPDPGKYSLTLREAMLYALGTPGKRIRPSLLLLACKAANGDENVALPYACAIEYIHNYSLIHDDLPSMDNDDFRRGRPTTHKVFGEAMAVLAGDGLLSAAFELMHADYLAHLHDPAGLRRRVRAGAAIASGCGCEGMVAGQAADIESESGNAEVEKKIQAEKLEYIHRNKTAALIKASAEAGAFVGGAGEGFLRNMTEYGEKIGLAFQIADDILDTGTEYGKMTYPACFGLEASKAKVEELSRQAVSAIEGAAGINDIYKGFLIEMAGMLSKREI